MIPETANGFILGYFAGFFLFLSIPYRVWCEEKIENTLQELKIEKREVLREMNENSKREINFELKLKDASNQEREDIKNHIRKVVLSTERLYSIARKMKNLWKEFESANQDQDRINKDYGRISGYIRKYLNAKEKANFDEFIRERIQLVLIYLDIEESLKNENLKFEKNKLIFLPT